MTAPWRGLIGFLMLALGVGALGAAPIPAADRFPEAVGGWVSPAVGGGATYRFLSSRHGWQVSGIAFKASEASDLNGSLATGILWPLATVPLADWLEVNPYVGLWGGGAGTLSLSGSGHRWTGAVGLSAAYGLEWLLADHWSFCVEMSQVAGLKWAKTRARGTDVEWAAAVFPQAGLFFRYRGAP